MNKEIDLIEAQKELEILRAMNKKLIAEIDSASKPMKVLNYRFPVSVKSRIKMITENMNVSESEIARYAMSVGLEKIEALAMDCNKSNYCDDEMFGKQ